MRHIFTILSLCVFYIFLSAIPSCRTISSIIGKRPVVAKVGKHKLYAEELARFIPSGITGEDSTKLALQYINTWTLSIIFMDTAEKELSKEELDVSEELEDYKRSLLKYRYEQQYVNQRLDTSLTEAQIKEYYEKHIDRFKLDAPIVKAHFIRISKTSPHIDKMKKMLAYSGEESNVGDSLLYSSAIIYTDFGKMWMPAATVAKECDTDVATMLSGLKNGYFEKENPNGNMNIVYILERKNTGETGPVDYHKERIKDILLSVRKKALLLDLERDLIERAHNEGSLVIY